MNPALKIFDVIPGFVYAGLLAASLVLMGVQEFRVNSAQNELAEAKTEIAEERQQRAEVARKAVEDRAALQAQHAAKQQGAEDEWALEKTRYENRIRSYAADDKRMRDKIAAYTARGRGTGKADAAAGVNQVDRLETVGGLLAEALELQSEGRAVIERRDAEVKRLVDQIAIDRAACSAPATP